MQRFVDNTLAVTKEWGRTPSIVKKFTLQQSVKTITYESLNNVAKLINGVSALLLVILPGKSSSILEVVHGWELKPTLRGPRLPRWMGSGVSSFNQFVHELSDNTDNCSSPDYSSAEEDIDEITCPSSPSTPNSRISRTSSHLRSSRRHRSWIRCIFSWILFPLHLFVTLLCYGASVFSFGMIKGSSLSTTQRPRLKRMLTLKDHVVQRATDNRRGIVEDLHLAMEISIESVFDVFHKATHWFFSPVELIGNLRRFILSSSSRQDVCITPEPLEITAILGDDDASLSENKTSLRHSLNTDARTCQDVITELGYPYEAIRVVTDDGYVVLLERIPRRDAKKVLYLQHGILDSSMGWVSNGVVGSPAFAAYDHGYDVFLGNFRGLVSREHVNENLSSKKYWRYSINEHGTKDIPAMIEKIHQVKTSELNLSQQSNAEEETSSDQPYKLSAISHSLGGAAMIMYIITSRIEKKTHRLSRLILLSPAGFHGDSNLAFSIVEHTLLFLSPILSLIIPAFYIPTKFFRMLLNKLARDFHNYPAVGGLVQTLMCYAVGGDSSNWVGILGQPHYNMNDMPGISFQVAVHLAQIKRLGRFRMYDYGSSAANEAAYRSPEPLDLGEHYNLIDMDVDLVAGKKDKVIKAEMVRKHYKLMKESSVEVSYKEFEYGHLDFTFSHREELLAYVMSRLLIGQKKAAAQKLASELKKTSKLE